MYSISSSLNMNPDELHITVSVVQFQKKGKSSFIQFQTFYNLDLIFVVCMSTGIICILNINT